MLVNLTLNTLFEAIKVAPVRGPAEADDWKWVLRSVSNRPILRADRRPVSRLWEAKRKRVSTI